MSDLLLKGQSCEKEPSTIPAGHQCPPNGL